MALSSGSRAPERRVESFCCDEQEMMKTADSKVARKARFRPFGWRVRVGFTRLGRTLGWRARAGFTRNELFG